MRRFLGNCMDQTSCYAREGDCSFTLHLRSMSAPSRGVTVLGYGNLWSIGYRLWSMSNVLSSLRSAEAKHLLNPGCHDA